MCQYINIVLPLDVEIERVESLLLKQGLGCNPFQNDFIVKQLSKGGKLINTTWKQCDCGSLLGSSVNKSSKNINNSDLDRLKRKKWSETKIKHWIENKNKTDHKGVEREKEGAQWLALLEEAISDNKIGKIGLYLHWHDNTIEEEKVVFIGKEFVSIKELDIDMLERIKYDVLYNFIK